MRPSPISQVGEAARHPGSAHGRRPDGVALRPRRPQAEAGHHPAGRDRHGDDDEQGGRGRHRAPRPSFPASRPPARPAPPTPTAMPGSSATPAIMSARLVRQRRLLAAQRMTGGSLRAMTWQTVMAMRTRASRSNRCRAWRPAPARRRSRRPASRRGADAAGGADAARRRRPGAGREADGRSGARARHAAAGRDVILAPRRR